MKNLFLATVATTLLTSSAAFAQPQKGSWLVGADLLNASAGISNPGANVADIMLSPKVGYFITDKFAIGTGVSFAGSFSPGKFSSIVVGASPFARYYFFPEKGAVTGRLYFFAEAHAGFATASAHDKISGSRYNNSGINAGIGPGITYFITPRISLESTLKLNYSRNVSGNYIANPQFRPSLGVGFQIYLGGNKKAEKLAE